MVQEEEAVWNAEKMRIFLEHNCRGHVTVKRMVPVWERAGHILRKKPKGCEAQLAYIRIHEKGTGLPIVVRIDGVYYDLDREYKDRNQSIGTAHSRADGIIYQSMLARTMSELYLKLRKQSSISAVIYNGVTENWCGEHVRHKGFNVVVSAKWRRHKRLAETIDVFLRCLPSMPDAILHVFGMLYNNKRVEHRNIKYYGMVSRKSLMKNIFAGSDLFIHLSKRDCCPNAVVEAIGAGIPVVTTNACGGAAEMCGMTPGCIVCESDKESYDPCYPYRDEYNRMGKGLKRELIRAILQVYEDRRRVRQPRELSIEYMAGQYIDMMRRISERPE